MQNFNFKNSLVYRLKRFLVLSFRFIFHHKTVVVIFSSMRAGSTLLKALMGEAPDVSNMPETDYRTYYSQKNGFDERIYKLSNKRILVMKFPFAFNDMGTVWPCPQGRNVKAIVLIRDAYNVVKSIETRSQVMQSAHMTKGDIVNYWCECYESILKTLESGHVEAHIIRYEDLIKSPKRETKNVFQFIGSRKHAGVENYSKPKSFEWKWGLDDGGENIQKLTVIKSLAEPALDDKELVEILSKSQRVHALRKKFGYTNNDYAEVTKVG